MKFVIIFNSLFPMLATGSTDAHTKHINTHTQTIRGPYHFLCVIKCWLNAIVKKGHIRETWINIIGTYFFFALCVFIFFAFQPNSFFAVEIVNYEYIHVSIALTFSWGWYSFRRFPTLVFISVSSLLITQKKNRNLCVCVCMLEIRRQRNCFWQNSCL